MLEGRIKILVTIVLLLSSHFIHSQQPLAEENSTETDLNKNHNILEENHEEIDKNLSATRIALVDLDTILRKSGASQRVRQLLDEKRLTFQEEFKIREAELQLNERKLLADKNTISNIEFNQRLKSFEEEVASLQQQIQYRHQALDQAFQEAQRNIRGLALEIVKTIASEQKLDFVLTNESTLIFLPRYDISESVLKRLNERTKNARIEIKTATTE